MWPRGRQVKSLFTDLEDVREDLEWLLHHELIEIRCIEPGDFQVAPEPLNDLEKSPRNIFTSAWYTIIWS